MKILTKKSAELTHATASVGEALTDAFHYIMLFAIGTAVVWSAGVEFVHLFSKRSASIEDILLLFIYLELGAMVGIYFKTKRMPVRFLIYVAITALTRMLVGIIQADHHLVETMPLEDLPVKPLLYIAGAILVLAIAALIIRFGSHKYPSTGLTSEVE